MTLGEDKNLHKILNIQQIFQNLNRCLLYVISYNFESQNAGLIDVKKGLY